MAIGFAEAAVEIGDHLALATAGSRADFALDSRLYRRLQLAGRPATAQPAHRRRFRHGHAGGELEKLDPRQICHRAAGGGTIIPAIFETHFVEPGKTLRSSATGHLAPPRCIRLDALRS